MIQTKRITYTNKEGERATYPLTAALESTNEEMNKGCNILRIFLLIYYKIIPAIRNCLIFIQFVLLPKPQNPFEMRYEFY